LGSIIQDNGSSDQETEKRISETRRVIIMLNSILWSRNILHGTKLTVYKTIVKSILTYGAETWTVKQKHRNKLLATEMDYLRRSARISRMDKIRNEAIRTKMGTKKNIVQEIEEQQLRWYGHVKRMEDGTIVKQVTELKPQGKRKRGRPINTWKDGIRESTKRRELKNQEYMDRDLWRRKIMSLG
jgi:hypothetical protein